MTWLLILLMGLGAAAGDTVASDRDLSGHHLIYLHGAIVEAQGLPAVHPVFGEYAFAEIVSTFEAAGFEVHAEVRTRKSDPWAHPRTTAALIDSLMATGVSPDHISVIGASLGGFIAGEVSHLVAEPEVRYVLLGSCSAGAQKRWQERDVQLHGHFLSIHEVSDTGRGPCSLAFSRCAESLPVVHEIAIDTGLQHGFLFQPLDAWVVPAVAWALRGRP